MTTCTCQLRSRASGVLSLVCVIEHVWQLHVANCVDSLAAASMPTLKESVLRKVSVSEFAQAKMDFREDVSDAVVTGKRRFTRRLRSLAATVTFSQRCTADIKADLADVKYELKATSRKVKSKGSHVRRQAELEKLVLLEHIEQYRSKIEMDLQEQQRYETETEASMRSSFERKRKLEQELSQVTGKLYSTSADSLADMLDEDQARRIRREFLAPIDLTASEGPATRKKRKFC